MFQEDMIAKTLSKFNETSLQFKLKLDNKIYNEVQTKYKINNLCRIQYLLKINF